MRCVRSAAVDHHNRSRHLGRTEAWRLLQHGWSAKQSSFEDVASSKHTLLSGWWYTYPSEKYESQLGLLFHMESHEIPWFQTTNQLWKVAHL